MHSFLTRQTFSFPGLQQDGPFSIQVSRLAALTQVGLRNVLSVDTHAVYVLPSATRQQREEVLINICHFLAVLTHMMVQKELVNAKNKYR